MNANREGFIRSWAQAMIGVFGIVTGAQAADCKLGERYVAVAGERAAAQDTEQAVTFLRRAIEVCPGYDAWQKLGEVLSLSTEPADEKAAVDAFVTAYELAASDKERARSLHRYAALLSRQGDPQNAYPLITQAVALDGADSEIAALAGEIDRQIQTPTREQLVRGLSTSLYRPLKVASGPTQASVAQPPQAIGSGPSVTIRVNFETSSTVVDEATRGNVRLLAQALADRSLIERRFLFVGHADVRGDATYNVQLSRDRAAAIHQSVVLIEPTLAGRIETTGKGSTEPLVSGDGPEAHRANRRLQVVVR